MQRVLIDDATLVYEDSGAGEPIVLIHGALIADAFRPLVAEPNLANRHRLIVYHRRGYGDSSGASGGITVARQAADCSALLHHLELESAHVVGHSFGGCIALQLALDAPQSVRSLTLLEPALMIGATGQSYRESLARGRQRYRDEPTEVVVDDFMEARWPAYRPRLDKILPGAFGQAVLDAEAAFETDVSGLLEWNFNKEKAWRISQPTLSVLGGASDALWPRFGEVHRLLLTWLPNTESFILPETTHFLQIENPRTMADALASFVTRRSAM